MGSTAKRAIESGIFDKKTDTTPPPEVPTAVAADGTAKRPGTNDRAAYSKAAGGRNRIVIPMAGAGGRSGLFIP